MVYVEGIWHHEHSDEPVLSFAELDGERYETRKVEVFRDGRVLIAGETHRADHLAEVPYPGLDEINADPQFELREVSAVVFETVWTLGRRSGGRFGGAELE